MKLVETVRTIYKELFILNISHSGYSANGTVQLADELQIIPDSQTRIHFNNYTMSSRFINNQLICFMRCNLFAPPATDPKIPFLPFDDETRLRFYITGNTSFLRKTDIAVTGAKQLYYFSNRFNAASGMFISNTAGDINNSDLRSVSLLAPEQACLAIVDVFSSGAVNANYELFTGAAHQLKSPEYKIQFKSKI
ncbi:hypothetical protein C3K47_05900 [Solitalea longa]|uniref:Uncharacterized protein n=1 Tax=Solitalea longa TaxID=2079460 RepID=A0A2S5A437_9SPHI|nr:hypothetical protein [Solitalea longa]POY37296.1 hypothetical protein C3K47_05900 [Solitalea longa]